ALGSAHRTSQRTLKYEEPDSTLAAKEPYKAILSHDSAFFGAVGQQQPDALLALEQALARTWLGRTPSEFESEVLAYLQVQKSEKFEKPYTELVYQPMLELFDLLTANDFRVFVCSGGGREFMRAFSESALGVPREHVIGTSPVYEYKDKEIRRGDQLLGGLALGPGKTEHIFAYAGRMPALAGGNADVDIEMLEAATFSLLVIHDDGEREFAYAKGAERAQAEAKANGWTTVSMKDDWSVIFP
ncbi:HAD family hydrolase, partial [Gordonia caeni]|uniref:HAD family hydrolase n=1 Tax=Gordonia caeni TaxID=1007097 RepID=UPI0031D904D4